MNLIGPSYNLESRPASVQRTINMVPVPLEAGNERTAFVFKDVPGLVSAVSEWDEAPPTDPFFADVHTLMMPLDATTPLINYAPAGGNISRGGGTQATPTATGGPFTGVGYIQGGVSNPFILGPPISTYYTSWTFDCWVNYQGTTGTLDMGLIYLPNNLALVLDTSPGDGSNGELKFLLSGISQWDSVVLSTGWRHIQLESKEVSASVVRSRIWVDGVLAMDGVALAVGSAEYTTGGTTYPTVSGPRGGMTGSAGFSRLAFPLSCWRLTLNANRNWDDATFTPPSTIAEYIPD
jgi:hypothetical protein